MQTITLQYLQHNYQQRIAIYFKKDAAIEKLLRQIPGLKWSRTHTCWHLPLHRDHYQQVITLLQGSANINSKPLLQHFKIEGNHAAVIQPAAKMPAVEKAGRPGSIHTINKHVLPALRQQLQLKAYSPSTIKTYLSEVQQFLQLIKANAADEFTPQRLKDYLQYCYDKLKLSENTLHSRINALKFYYEQVIKKEKLFWEIPRPKKQQQNPSFFNQDEITDILKQTNNLKHKTMLMLTYSTGMRISEVTALKVWQIDSKRMQILVQQAKGKKDRVTPLSPVMLVMLREYFTTYKPDKKGYLFYGQIPGEPYSTRSLQLVLQAAKQRAGILKPGSVHALRHSFATHLLDNGTDVTMIMKLLGHNDLKTTMRYLHVTNRDVLKIISPLDHLNLG